VLKAVAGPGVTESGVSRHHPRFLAFFRPSPSDAAFSHRTASSSGIEPATRWTKRLHDGFGRISYVLESRDNLAYEVEVAALLQQPIESRARFRGQRLKSHLNFPAPS